MSFLVCEAEMQNRTLEVMSGVALSDVSFVSFLTSHNLTTESWDKVGRLTGRRRPQ